MDCESGGAAARHCRPPEGNGGVHHERRALTAERKRAVSVLPVRERWGPGGGSVPDRGAVGCALE